MIQILLFFFFFSFYLIQMVAKVMDLVYQYTRLTILSRIYKYSYLFNQSKNVIYIIYIKQTHTSLFDGLLIIDISLSSVSLPLSSCLFSSFSSFSLPLFSFLFSIFSSFSLSLFC